MKPAVTLCLAPEIREGPFLFHGELAEGCAWAEEFGFEGVEIFPSSPTELDIAETQALLDHHHLEVAAVSTAGGWILHQWSLTSSDANVRARARDFVRSVIDFAGGFGAPAILDLVQGRHEPPVIPELALAWLGDALEDLAEHAWHHHVSLLYEPLNRYESNLFNRIEDAAEWISSLRTKNVRLLCDLFHMAMEESNIPDAIRSCIDVIGLVHFADSNRRAMGMGHTDAEAIITALHDIGYTGYLSAEVLPLPDADTAARRSIESFRQLVRPSFAEALEREYPSLMPL